MNKHFDANDILTAQDMNDIIAAITSVEEDVADISIDVGDIVYTAGDGIDITNKVVSVNSELSGSIDELEATVASHSTNLSTIGGNITSLNSSVTSLENTKADKASILPYGLTYDNSTQSITLSDGNNSSTITLQGISQYIGGTGITVNGNLISLNTNSFPYHLISILNNLTLASINVTLLESDIDDGVVTLSLGLNTTSISLNNIYEVSVTSSVWNMLESYDDFSCEIQETEIYSGTGYEVKSFLQNGFRIYYYNDNWHLVDSTFLKRILEQSSGGGGSGGGATYTQSTGVIVDNINYTIGIDDSVVATQLDLSDHINAAELDHANNSVTWRKLAEEVQEKIDNGDISIISSTITSYSTSGTDVTAICDVSPAQDSNYYALIDSDLIDYFSNAAGTVFSSCTIGGIEIISEILGATEATGVTLETTLTRLCSGSVLLRYISGDWAEIPIKLADRVANLEVSARIDKVGELTSLTTTNKASAVAAINEINSNVGTANAVLTQLLTIGVNNNA